MEKHPDPLSAVLLVLVIGDVPSSSPGCLLPEPSDRLPEQIQTATVLADQVQSSINKNKWSLSLIFAEMAIKSVESCFSFLNLKNDDLQSTFSYLPSWIVSGWAARVSVGRCVRPTHPTPSPFPLRLCPSSSRIWPTASIDYTSSISQATCRPLPLRIRDNLLGTKTFLKRDWRKYLELPLRLYPI